MTKRWTDEKIALLRELSATHAQEEAAKILGLPYGGLRHACYENGIKFIYKRDARLDLIERVRELAPNHSRGEIGKILGITRMSVSGLCDRNGIVTAGGSGKPPAMTPEERRARKTELERQRRNKFYAVGLKGNGEEYKPRSEYAKSGPKNALVKVSRFQLLGGASVAYETAEDRIQVAAERAARAARQERQQSTMEICRMYAAGKFNRHEMLRRLSISQRAA